MREIKFRACDGKNVYENQSMEQFLSDDPEAVFNTWPSDTFFLMCTGLKDKNGKEVYEGDIVTCSVGCLHEVYWRDAQPFMGIGGWGLRGISNDYDWIGSDEEVVGNIYDNGDLIKASQLAEGV